MIKIWGRRSSANVQKVMWMLGELGLEYRHVPAGGPYGIVNTPEFRALNPNGLVPVIDDDGMVLWESNAIVRYLASQYGGETFWPSSPRERAGLDKWMDWSASTLQAHFIGLFVSYWRTPENLRDAKKIAALHDSVVADLTLLGRVLSQQPFLGGNAFSIADIPNGVHLYRFYTMGIPAPSLPNIEAYYARLEKRPAYRENVMISYEELRGRMTF